MQGYLTKKGVVFTTGLRVMSGTDIIAEPGDLLLIEDDKLMNLSRAATKNPRVTFPTAGAVFHPASEN